MELPEEYGCIEYQKMYVFANGDNSDRGFIIYVKDDIGLKKSVWDIDKSDLDRLVSLLAVGSNIVSTDRKAKLGSEKAVKVTLEEDGDYLEVYILASNKYIYMVMFTGKSEADLNNSDYAMVKKSFKLKDRTTNPIVIYVLIAMIGIGIKVFISMRKNRNMYQNPVMHVNNTLDSNLEDTDEFNE